MSGKSLNLIGNGYLLGATVLSPADFPIGSPQSRAAARAMLSERRPKLCSADHDALLLYRGCCWLVASMEPDYSDLERTRAYRRGEDLHDEIHGPVVPAYLDLHYKRSTQASLRFELVFGREPEPGDILRYIDVKNSHGAFLSSIGSFIGAWQRQIPDMLCPLKLENGRLYRHLRKGACSPCNGLAALNGGWHEAIDEGPEWRWRDLEQEALGKIGPPVNLAQIPRVVAVVFLGVADGKHRCRPATAEELQRAASRAEAGGHCVRLLG